MFYRVPYLIRGPTVTANHTSAAVVSNLDIVPTVLHLAGVEPRYELDGKPLVSHSTVKRFVGRLAACLPL